MNSFQNSVNDLGILFKDALEFDTVDNNLTEAKFDIYQKYIKCLKATFTLLDEDSNFCISANKIENLEYIRENHVKLLKSSKNCVDRLLKLIPEENERKTLSLPQCPCSEKNLGNKSLSLTSLPSLPSIDSMLAEKPVNPMSTAKLQIMKIIESSKKLLKSDKLTNAERASIQLNVSRRIEEILSIARRREDEFCQVQINSLDLLAQNIQDDIDKYKFLKDNTDFPSLYRASQLFYHHILKDSKTYSIVKSSHTPESSCLTFILQMNNSVHPVLDYINKSVNTILNIPIRKENKNVLIDEIDSFKDKMENLSKLCCLIINIDLTDHIRVMSPKLLNVLFGFIFKNDRLGGFIYRFLFEIYDDDLKRYNANAKFLEENHNQQIILSEKFRDQSGIISILDAQAKEFKKLREGLNPLEKINIVSQIITDLMSKIQNENSKLEIGADELVPILVYIIIRYNSPEVFLHGKYLEHLMPGTYLNGIEGYMLVSIICAITFSVSEDFSRKVCTS